MGMTPTEFFESFVEGNAYDCNESPGCVRRAFNASVSASHLADHYFEFNHRHNPALVSGFSDIGKYAAHLSKETAGAFKDIRSIANAYKHLYTDSSKGPSVHSTVNSSGSIESVLISDDEALSGLDEEYFHASSEAPARSAVVFRRKDGSQSEFLPALNVTIDYWRNVIYGRA
ncbi:hypothetical protein ACFQ0F_05855 [Paraperlucidibaca wandonensis]|uniref:Uncharacterized protein n=1 Tax=Paraperlucidibaca wandonensis TaxID=1268273 RepID=A0ABW3HGY7_9GAMM